MQTASNWEFSLYSATPCVFIFKACRIALCLAWSYSGELNSSCPVAIVPAVETLQSVLCRYGLWQTVLSDGNRKVPKDCSPSWAWSRSYRRSPWPQAAGNKGQDTRRKKEERAGVCSTDAEHSWARHDFWLISCTNSLRWPDKNPTSWSL